MSENDVYEYNKQEVDTRRGHVLKVLRERKKITQKQLGKMIGRSDGAVSAWEKGTRHMDDEMINEVSKALGIHPLTLKADTSLRFASDVVDIDKRIKAISLFGEMLNKKGKIDILPAIIHLITGELSEDPKK